VTGPSQDFLEKLHAFFLKMVSISGDQLILKFLEISMLFSEMVSISDDRPILKFLESSTLF
jgi:hypothetical protein